MGAGALIGTLVGTSAAVCMVDGGAVVSGRWAGSGSGAAVERSVEVLWAWLRSAMGSSDVMVFVLARGPLFEDIV